MHKVPGLNYISQDSAGNNLTCANNCRGVNPNSVIIAGGAALAEASVGDFVAPTLGLGAAAAALSAAAAAGGTLAYLAALQCPKSRPCRVRQIMIKRERGIDFFSGPLSPKSSAEGLLRVDWYSSREDKVSDYLSVVD